MDHLPSNAERPTVFGWSLHRKTCGRINGECFGPSPLPSEHHSHPAIHRPVPQIFEKNVCSFSDYFSNVPNFGHLFTLFASADRKKSAVQRTLHGEDATYSSTHSSFCAGHVRREFDTQRAWPKLGTRS